MLHADSIDWLHSSTPCNPQHIKSRNPSVLTVQVTVVAWAGHDALGRRSHPSNLLLEPRSRTRPFFGRTMSCLDKMTDRVRYGLHVRSAGSYASKPLPSPYFVARVLLLYDYYPCQRCSRFAVPAIGISPGTWRRAPSPPRLLLDSCFAGMAAGLRHENRGW